VRLQCEAECATRVKCNRPHISIRLAPPATMKDAVALCHAKELTITDELPPRYIVGVDQAGDSARVYSVFRRNGDDSLTVLYTGTFPPEAPDPDAALDEATERAAEAWGVGVREVAVRLWNPDDPGLRYQASSPNADVMGYGPTRTAALEALAAKAKAKLSEPEDMTLRDVEDEVANLLQIERADVYNQRALLAALRARDGVDETGKDERP